VVAVGLDAFEVHHEHVASLRALDGNRAGQRVARRGHALAAAVIAEGVGRRGGDAVARRHGEHRRLSGERVAVLGRFEVMVGHRGLLARCVWAAL
jgi:hypothetical protein